MDVSKPPVPSTEVDAKEAKAAVQGENVSLHELNDPEAIECRQKIHTVHPAAAAPRPAEERHTELADATQQPIATHSQAQAECQAFFARELAQWLDEFPDQAPSFRAVLEEGLEHSKSILTTNAASFKKHPTTVSSGYELEDHALNTTDTGVDAKGSELADATESSCPASGPLSEEHADGVDATGYQIIGTEPQAAVAPPPVASVTAPSSSPDTDAEDFATRFDRALDEKNECKKWMQLARTSDSFDTQAQNMCSTISLELHTPEDKKILKTANMGGIASSPHVL